MEISSSSNLNVLEKVDERISASIDWKKEVANGKEKFQNEIPGLYFK